MSKIGKKHIVVPSEVKVQINNNLINFEGPKGKKTIEIHKSLIGSSPSNLIGIDKLSPNRIGKLISMYEHKVFVEGIIWNINSYDQWGVEEAKIQAKKNLKKI